MPEPMLDAIVVGAGLLYMLAVRPYDHGNVPAGDAWIANKIGGDA